MRCLTPTPPSSPPPHTAAVLIFVLFSLYPTLIASAIGVMRCSESIDGKYYLVEDYAKECYTEEHNWYVGFGVVFTAIYALGIPLGAFILIWSFRKPIADGNATAHSSLGFLFAGYSTTRGGFIAAWESMIMLRKLVITLLSIIDFSPAVQVRRRCSSAPLPGVLRVTRSLLPPNRLPSPSHSSSCSRCSC